MAKVAILYSSTHGHTRKIIDRLQKQLGEHDYQLLDLHTAPSLEGEFDLMLIGASISYGHFHPELYHFIHRHQQCIETGNSAFFGVNLTARKAGKDTVANNAYMQKFLKKSPWQPACCAVFAGALRYSQYTWWQTLLIQLIMKMTGGSTDKSRDLEFTDWEQVDDFARRLRSTLA